MTSLLLVGGLASNWHLLFTKIMPSPSWIETAQALAAVTSSDDVNAIVIRIEQDIYHAKRLVARNYNPRRAPIYEKLNLQMVSSSAWGRIEWRKFSSTLACRMCLRPATAKCKYTN